MANNSQVKMSGKAKGGVAAAAMAAMLLVASPFVDRWEGHSNDPYLDIVNVWTVCGGETRVPMRRYSDAECREMLNTGLAEFADAAVKRNPTLRDHPKQWAMATSLSYNIGMPAYRKSTVARRFDEGRWISACNNFLSWKYAGGRVVRGLLNRRNAERKICLEDIPAKYARS